MKEKEESNLEIQFDLTIDKQIAKNIYNIQGNATINNLIFNGAFSESPMLSEEYNQKIKINRNVDYNLVLQKNLRIKLLLIGKMK